MTNYNIPATIMALLLLAIQSITIYTQLYTSNLHIIEQGRSSPPGPGVSLQ